MAFELIRTDKPELASLEALNAAILEMQEAMKDKVYDLTNPKGRKVATTDRSKLLKIRTGTEKTRNELNRPHIDGKRLIDRIAKNITAAVVEVEGPLVEIIRADDERKAKIKAEKEEKERKRKADIQDVIHKIADTPNRLNGMDSTQLSVVFAAMVDYEIDDSFMEFADQASAALAKATEEVSLRLAEVIKTEEEDAARKAEDERLRKQKEDLDRRQAEIEAQEKPEPAEVKHEEPKAAATEEKTLFSGGENVDSVVDVHANVEPEVAHVCNSDQKEDEPPTCNEHTDVLLSPDQATISTIYALCSESSITKQERLEQIEYICVQYLNQGGGS